MPTTNVNSRHQISLPSEARQQRGIEAGDTLSVTVRGDELILRRRSARASERLRGLAVGSYRPDPDSYLRELRDEDKAGFRTERWRAMEREADEDIAAGRATTVDGLKGLISHIDS